MPAEYITVSPPLPVLPRRLSASCSPGGPTYGIDKAVPQRAHRFGGGRDVELARKQEKARRASEQRERAALCLDLCERWKVSFIFLSFAMTAPRPPVPSSSGAAGAAAAGGAARAPPPPPVAPRAPSSAATPRAAPTPSPSINASLPSSSSSSLASRALASAQSMAAALHASRARVAELGECTRLEGTDFRKG